MRDSEAEADRVEDCVGVTEGVGDCVFEVDRVGDFVVVAEGVGD